MSGPRPPAAPTPDSGDARILAGRVAVVTGGGRGIGEAIARSLSAAGARVVVAARTEAEIDAVAASLGGEDGGAWGVRCDVTDPKSVEALATRTAELAGSPADVLVCNAGIADSGAIHRTTLDQWDRIMAVNATGTFLCLRAFLPAMMERRWGRAVVVASVAGLRGTRYIAAYAASKHAAVGLVRSAAADVASKGVTVNAVCPGYVDTPMTDDTVARVRERTGLSADEALAAVLATTGQHRLIRPDEVAHAVLSLCHPAAGATTGQTLELDGSAA